MKKDKQIKIIVVPVRLDGDDTPYTENTGLWQEALDKAEKAGIIVYDCSARNNFGACYIDSKDADSLKKVRPGYPQDETKDASSQKVLLPISPYTVAEESEEGLCKYQYIPSTAIIWTPPYAAGLTALAMQCGGEKHTKDELFDIMYKSAYVLKDGLKEYRVINPAEFIKTIKSK